MCILIIIHTHIIYHMPHLNLSSSAHSAQRSRGLTRSPHGGGGGAADGSKQELVMRVNPQVIAEEDRLG